jgi:purine-binding chemotaxis protein CheW
MELLIVEIDHAYVGVPTSDVKEVVRAARISPAPGGNANIKGLLNLRGTVVPVVALRTLLGLEDREIISTDHFIVLQTQSTTFAVHVDRAVEILNVSVPTSDSADPSFAASVPHAAFGVVHIHRGCSLWTQAALSSSFGVRSDDQHESTSLP